jgi:hypothetical protein
MTDHHDPPTTGQPREGRDRKYGPKTVRTERGTFARGNPGKPKGARHRTTLAVECLLDGEAERLTRKAIEMALAGDGPALRLCMDRIAPPQRDRPVAFPLPALVTPSDAVKASAAVVAAVAGGELTPSEAANLSGLIDHFVRAFVASEFEARLTALESKGG